MKKFLVATEYHGAILVTQKKPHETWTCKECIKHIQWVFSRTVGIPHYINYNMALTLWEGVL